MKPVNPNINNFPGYTSRRVNVNTMLSNTINLLCGGNRRAAWRSAVSMETLSRMFVNALNSETQWLGTSERIVNERDAKARADLVVSNYKEFAIEVAFDPIAVSDLGLEIATNLRDGGFGWTSFNALSPPLGYAREVLKFNTGSSLTKECGTRTTSPASAWNMDIGMTLLTLDRTRMSVACVPTPKAEFHGHSYKDQPFGSLYAAMESARRVWAMFTLYNIQGSLLPLHVNRRWVRACWELAYSRSVKSKDALERWMEAYEFLLAIPLHPVLQYIAGTLQTGSVTTYDGQRDILYRYGVDIESFPKVLGVNGSDGPGIPNQMGEPILRAALNAVESSNSTAIWAGSSSFAMPVSKADGGELPTARQSEESSLDIDFLARQVKSIQKIADFWPDVTRTLGWQGGSGDVGTVNQAGADFIITDGIGYSEPPAVGLLGLRPVISAGFYGINGFQRRFDAEWNVRPGTEIKYSVINVTGYQSPTTGGQMYERNFIMAGMWQGEEGFEARYASLVNGDRTGQQVIRFYASKVQKYVEIGFQEPDLKNAEQELKPTDWYAWSVGDDVSRVNNAYQKAYAAYLETVSEAEFYYRASFSHRVVAAMSWIGEWEMFNEFGSFEYYYPQDGHVMWSGDITISIADTTLQQLVDTAVGNNVPGMEKAPAVSSNVVVSA